MNWLSTITSLFAMVSFIGVFAFVINRLHDSQFKRYKDARRILRLEHVVRQSYLVLLNCPDLLLYSTIMNRKRAMHIVQEARNLLKSEL